MFLLVIASPIPAYFQEYYLGISPDGTIKAEADDEQLTVKLKSQTDELLFQFEVPDCREILGLQWIERRMLRVDSSAGHIANWYDLWKVAEDGRSAELWKRSITHGGDCSVSLGYQTLVCYASDNVDREYIDIHDLEEVYQVDEFVYWGWNSFNYPKLMDELAEVTPHEKASLKVPGMVTLNLDVPTSVYVPGYRKCPNAPKDNPNLSCIYMKYSTPTITNFNTDMYTWDCYQKTCFREEGMVFLFRTGWYSSIVYAIAPVFISKNKGILEFRGYKLDAHGITMEKPVFWAPSGKRFAIVEQISGRRFLAILTKQEGKNQWIGKRYPMDDMSASIEKVDFLDNENPWF